MAFAPPTVKTESSLGFNHAVVRKVFNEMVQKRFVYLLDRVDAYGNAGGWQCGEFRCKTVHLTFHFKPNPKIWYKTKKMAVAVAYYEVLMQLEMGEALKIAIVQPSSIECDQCEALQARIDELENELSWFVNNR